MNRLVPLALLTLALAAAAPARAQEPDAAHARLAREVALRFLTEGPDAPRPGVTRAQVDAAPAAAEEGLPGHGPLVVLRVAGGVVSVGRTGQVHGWDDPRGGLWVASTDGAGRPRSAADIAAETSARCLFAAEQLEARARAFLARTIDGFAGRNFVQYVSRLVTASPVEHDLLLFEERRPGQLAIMPNYVRVALSPETGRVVRYLGSGHRGEVTRPPAIHEAGARRIVRELLGLEPARAHLSMTLRAGSSLAATSNDRTPRAVWIVRSAADSNAPWVVKVDATDGAVLERH